MRGFLHLDCGVAAAQLALDHKSAVASLVSDHFHCARGLSWLFLLPRQDQQPGLRCLEISGHNMELLLLFEKLCGTLRSHGLVVVGPVVVHVQWSLSHGCPEDLAAQYYELLLV
jgi:hypothetical protein